MEAEPAVAVTLGRAFTVMSCVLVAVHPDADVPVTVYVVVAAGFTVTEVPVNDPGIHTYVLAPEPVRVVGLPAQTVVDDAVEVTTGLLFTTTVTVEVPVHPGPLDPVTVYVVVVPGDTVTEDPVSEPGIHVYVVVPLAVSVADPPAQIEGEEELAVTVGAEPTVIVIV